MVMAEVENKTNSAQKKRHFNGTGDVNESPSSEKRAAKKGLPLTMQQACCNGTHILTPAA